MTLTGQVYQQRRGCYTKLIFLFNYGGGNFQLDSGEYTIFDLAKVRFKFQFDNVGNRLHSSVSSKKLPKAKDSIIKIKVSCEVPKYSESWKCPSEWTEWKRIGYLGDERNEPSPPNTFLVNVYVFRLKEPSPRAEVHRDQEFVDFNLVAAGGHVPVHKVFLATHSEVFHTLLNGEWKNADKGRIDLKGVTKLTLENLKAYLYLDVLPDENLLTLLLLAKRYLITNLKNDCIVKLSLDITAENLYPYLEFACENNIPELTFAIMQRTPDEILHAAALKMRENESADGADPSEAEQ